MQYLAAQSTGQRLVLLSHTNTGFIICADCLRQIQQLHDCAGNIYLLPEDMAWRNNPLIRNFGCCADPRSRACKDREGQVFGHLNR